MTSPTRLIYLTVTNDLVYDQRMHRICQSLHQAGYGVTLVGRLRPESPPLPARGYRQVRLPLTRQHGKRFYLQYNYRLYRWLVQEIGQQAPGNVAICAIDLDTIIPCARVAARYQATKVYDAHELFTELTEVKRRPLIHLAWLMVEKWFVPGFKHGYTVNQFIANEFKRRYGVQYAVIRNLPWSKAAHAAPDNLPNLPDRFFLYQGAVNEGRAFDLLIPAMKKAELPLVIAGDGNYLPRVRELIAQHGLTKQVILLGYVAPDTLRHITPRAFAGITLFDNTGLNQYYSLANRFFDYIQAGIPQLCNHYPEYAEINAQFEVALLVDPLSEETIAAGLNKLVHNPVLYKHLQQQSLAASPVLCWESEEKKLLRLWQEIFPVRTNP